MSIKINTTGVSDINVESGSSVVSLKRVDVIKNNVTTQVWGKREFDLYSIGSPYYNSLNINYNDAGDYSKSYSPVFVFENKIFIDKVNFTLEEILSYLRYGNSSEASWYRFNGETDKVVWNGDQFCTIVGSTDPLINAGSTGSTYNFFTDSGCGLMILASNASNASYGTNTTDAWDYWELAYFDYRANRDTTKTPMNYLWLSTLGSSSSYPRSRSAMIGNRTTNGFINEKPSDYYDNVEITDKYIIITLPETMSYEDSDMQFHVGKFEGYMGKYSRDNVGFDQSVTVSSTTKSQTYEYTYDIGVSGKTYSYSDDFGVVSSRSHINQYAYTSQGHTSDVLSTIRHSSMNINDVIYNSTGVSYGTSIYMRVNCAEGYFPQGTEGVDYFSYESSLGTIYYVWRGPYVVDENDFTLTLPSTINTNGSSLKAFSNVFDRVSWTLNITIGSNVGSVSYTTTDGRSGTLTSSGSITNLDYSTTITLTAVGTDGETTPWTFSGTGTKSCPTTTGITRSLSVTLSATRRSYTITFTKGSYGSWSNTSRTGYYGDTISRSGDVVSIYKWDDGTLRDSSTYTLNSDTAQYSYSNTYSTITSPITSAQTIKSTDTRTLRTYTITLASTYGHWTNSSGTTITSISDVAYGTSISKSSNVLTIGSNTYTFVKNSDTTSYNYVFSSISWSPSGSTITGATTVTGVATRYSRPYVYITAGTGVSSVYTSTSSTATSGNASGTRYDRGSTVYGFAVLSTGYNAASGWTLVSGTAGTAGAKYRTSSISNITSNYNFGTINAVAKTYTVTLASNNGYWTNSGGSTISSTTASYGSSVSVSGSTLTIASSAYTFHANSGYEVTSITGAPSTITGNVTITGNTQSSIPTLVVSSGSKYFGTSGKSSYTIGSQSQFSSYTGRSMTMSGTMTITRQSGSSTTFGNTTLTWNSYSNRWMIGWLFAWDDGSEDYGSAEIDLYIDQSGNLIAYHDANNTYNLDYSSIPVSVSWSNLTFTPQ